MPKWIEKLLPHAAILICNMYIVFFLIDRVNPAMNFIDNGLTKALLLALCAVAFLNGLRLLRPMPSRRPAAAPRRPDPIRREPNTRLQPRNGGYAPGADRYPTRSGQYAARYGGYCAGEGSARSASASYRSTEPRARRSQTGYASRSRFEDGYDTPRRTTYRREALR